MKVFMYQAALYCEECGEAIRARLKAEGQAPEDSDDEGSYDSDDYPKGPMDEGEADCPNHCDACGEFLETRLTSDGRDYVREAVLNARKKFKVETKGMTPDEADDHKSYSVALAQWEPFYEDEIDFEDETDYD